MLVGSPRLLDLFADGPAERIPVDANVAGVLDHVGELHRAGRRVVVLVSGDPGLFSLGRSVAARFGRGHCVFVPAVSSVQAAFAAVALDWADAVILSAHGRMPHNSAAELSQRAKIAVLAGTKEAIAWCAELARAVASTHAAALCENLTLPDERVRWIEAKELALADASSVCIVLLISRELR